MAEQTASIHTELVRKFNAAEDASKDARSESERGRDYYDGRQLTPEQIAALKKRKQPIVIENLVRPKIDYLCGLERQSRTDPKAYPRTAAHEDAADAATDALRYVTEDQDFPIKRSAVFNNMLVEGYGGVEVGHHEVRGMIDPAISLIAWDRLFYDPHSCKPDFSDASYLGFVTWMDFDTAKARWPEKEVILSAALNAGGSATVGETFDDKPKWKSWVDTNRRRVRIVTIYYKSADGTWMRSVYTISGELEDSAPSPYVDEDGKPECALIMQAAYVDRDNDRYGVVRDYMTLQDEVNKRRSKFLHLANSRPVRVDPASGLSAIEARREFNSPDGVLIAGPGEVEDLSNHNMAAGHFTLLAEAKDAIKSVGPNATMQGKAGSDQSGRAILALQQGGMTEMAPIMDGLRHFNIRVYRALWNRVRQFWTEERWVRITDDENGVQFVGMNTTKGKMAAMKVRGALQAGEIDQQQAMQYAAQLESDPAMMQPANVIAELDVDIQIDEVLDTPTLQIEQFEQLVKLAPMTPPQYLPTMFEMLVEASNLRNKDKLRKIMEKAQTAPDPAQQAMQQLQMAAAQADVEKTQSEAQRNVATAEATIAGVQIDAFQAGVGIAA